MAEIHDYLQDTPVLVFFLVLGLGYLIGGVRLFGISLGSVGGVLLAGLLFGHLGFSMYPGVQTFGFAIFIFCVGYQAGPQFFDVLLTSGLKYLTLALVVAGTGFALAVSLSGALELAPGLAAGLLGGAMTTTPTLAAAQDAVRSGLVDLPPGLTADDVITNIGAGYALTYLIGLVGLILTIRLIPRLLDIDLPAEAAKLMVGKAARGGPDLSEVTRRTYRVTRTDELDRTVGEIERGAPGGVSIAAIRRRGERIPVERDTRFEVGDEILVVGRVQLLLEHASSLGEEIADAEGRSVPMETARVVVSKPAVLGKPLGEIRLEERLGTLPLHVRRQRTELPLTGDLVLRRGDVITIYGPEDAIDRVVRQVGYVDQDVTETDLFTFAVGIAAGIALGTATVRFGDISVGLGMAGGLLVTGLLIGFLRSIWPVFGRVPSASRWVLMELGLLLFMAGVGINSGGSLVEIVQSAGAKLIGAGVIVALAPVFVGYAFSRKVLRLNPAEALGAVTGSMTSGAALSVVTAAAKSDVPALGYTGAYAFANVILTIAGTLIMLW
jgi:putative transport protein